MFEVMPNQIAITPGPPLPERVVQTVLAGLTRFFLVQPIEVIGVTRVDAA